MKKYTYYIIITLTSLLVKLLNPIMIYLVYPYREKARNVVYSYFKRKNIEVAFFNKDKVLPKQTFKNKLLDWLEYQWYKWTVWIWLDDTVDNDIVDANTIWNFRVDHVYPDNVLDNYVTYLIDKYFKLETVNKPLISSNTMHPKINKNIIPLLYIQQYVSDMNNFNLFYGYKHYNNELVFVSGILKWIPVKKSIYYKIKHI